jgi:hypothetical protein
MIADKTNGRIWQKIDEKTKEIKILRVYDDCKGYAQINDNGVNIDKVSRHYYQSVQDMLNTNGVNNYRA